MACWKAAMGASDGRTGAESTATGPSMPESVRARARNAGAFRKRSGIPGRPGPAWIGPSWPASTAPPLDPLTAATTTAASAGARVETGFDPRKVRSAPVAAWRRPVQRGSMGSPKARATPRSLRTTATA